MTDRNTAALDPAERTRCEVWTRVMGYHRPVSAFNNGKRAEHADRCYFTENPRGTPLYSPQSRAPQSRVPQLCIRQAAA